MPVDAGTVFSQVRVELDKLDGDVRAVVANFDKIVAKSTLSTAQVAKSWDGVQASVGNIDKTYRGLLGTYDTVAQKQQVVLASIRDLIGRGVDPENERVKALKDQYNQLQAQTDKTQAANQAQAKKLEDLRSAYTNVSIAIGAAIAFAKKLIDAWVPAEQAEMRMAAAAKLTGREFTGTSERLLEYGKVLQKTSGFEDEQVQNLMQQALFMGRTEEQAKTLALAATQLAQTGIMGVDEAFTQLAVTYDGMAPRNKVLKSLIGSLTEEELRNGKAVDEIARKTDGMNEAMMGITGGGLKSMKNAFGELTESAGRSLALVAGPAFKPMADLVNKLSESINKVFDMREAQVALANGTATATQAVRASNEAYKVHQGMIADLAAEYIRVRDASSGMFRGGEAERTQTLAGIAARQKALKQETEEWRKAGDAAKEKVAQEGKAAKVAEENNRQQAISNALSEPQKKYAADILEIQKLQTAGLIDEVEAQGRTIKATEELMDAYLKLGSIGSKAFTETAEKLRVLRNESEFSAQSQKEYTAALEAESKARAEGVAADAAADVAAYDRLEKAQAGYADKLARVGATTIDLIELDRKKAVADIEASETSIEWKGKEIAALNEFYDALEKKTKDKEFLKSMKETADTIGEYFGNLAGAMTDLIGAANERRQEQLDEQLEQTIQGLDDQMQAELEALGLQEETEMESLQRQLKEAEDAGDAETAAELRDQIDRLTITQKYDKLEAEETKRVEKEKAQIEYEAELQQWQWQMAQALADAARAIVNIWSTWAWNPIVAGIMTGVTAAVTGIQIAAIEEARPSPPKFETGGIVLPSGKSGGTLVDVAEGGSSELLLNDSPAGKAMLRSFAAEIVGEMVAQMTLGTLVLPLQVDADVLGKVITQLTFTKQARVNKGAIVG